MDGFFSAAPLRPIVDTADESVEKFAQAIAGRFNSADRPLLTARLTPAFAEPSTPLQQRRVRAVADSRAITPSLSPTPVSPMARMAINPLTVRQTPSSSSAVASSPSSMSFSLITPSCISRILRTPSVLIIDIRPHSAYASARLPHAISLSVPSTLLKRPAFTLEKLAAMLPSTTARSHFSAWAKASCILVYDTDSAGLSEGSNLLGLLRKFRLEGFKGNLAWLQGGIQSVWKEQRSLIEEGPVSDDEEDNESSDGVLRGSSLPVAAFTSSSTLTRGNSPMTVSSPLFKTSRTSNMPSSQLYTSRPGSQRGDHCPPSKLTAANPFYDNIRQNLELSQGITDRIPLNLSDKTTARVNDLPFTWLRDIASHAGQDDSTDALAMQFHRIELGEQRRLQGIMAHHSQAGVEVQQEKDMELKKEIVSASNQFAYSILAGIEKGDKNRYRNIWPFEHSRVKLKTRLKSDDYINASFVQPLSTRRRYIATQGPMESTYNDFWSIVWEQKVHVIVMLTKQFEGGSIKCGKYWNDGIYGPLRLKCIAVTGAPEEEPAGQKTSGFFVQREGLMDGDVTDDGGHNYTTRRIFQLSHSSFPDREPRIVTQLQYVGWPDMDVPANPRSILRFVKEVDALVDDVNSITAKDHDVQHSSPALLHCSAGVGRTGSFIIIDAVLDGIRREIRKKTERKYNSFSTRDDSSDGDQSPNAMEIDASRDVSVQPTSLSQTSSTTPQFAAMSPSSKTAPVQLQKSKIHGGPTATLHIGGVSSGGGNDIHIPVVPSSTSPLDLQTPRPPEAKEMQNTAATSKSNIHHAGDTGRGDKRARPLAISRPSQRRILASDFTIADADLMFTGSSINPAFAMDVESVQPQDMWTLHSTINGNSSSGDGTGSGGDMASAGSGSGSRSSGSISGSSARNKFITPMAMALAKMSSSEDVPGPMDRTEASPYMTRGRLAPRLRAGSGSGSGEGRSIHGSGSGSGSGSVNGGYTSSSSLGLGMFSGMGITSPTPSVPEVVSEDSLESKETQPSKQTPAAKPSLVAPKPVHPLQPPPQIIEAALSRNSVQDRYRTQGNRSSTQSSSSAPSTDVLSSTSSPPGESSETPESVHNLSRVSSPSSKSTRNMTNYDFMKPRQLNSGGSPPFPSSLEEPIREILEDMREQRMNLCQTLRQYVFVNKAIIEGALKIVDEERKRTGVSEDDADFDPSSIIPEASGLLFGKRGASPTELPKENRKGEVALAKRPSFRRGKSTSSGESTGSA